jgi:hypothetical protein
MLGNEMTEAKEGILQITDISSEAMQLLLTYIYSGLSETKFDPNERWTECIEEIVYAADKARKNPKITVQLQLKKILNKQ